MSQKKAIITNWDNGVTTSIRANSVEELNTGFAVIKNFDIFSDTKKAIPVPEWSNWATQDETGYDFKGLGSGNQTFYATGKARTNWWSDNWQYRVKITPASVLTPYFLFDLSDMPSTFWDNVQTNGEDIRVVSDTGAYIESDILLFDKVNETGKLAFKKVDSSSFYYIYYGNATVDRIVDGLNTGVDRSSVYGVNYVYTFQDTTAEYPANRVEILTSNEELNTSDTSLYGSSVSGFITNGLTGKVGGSIYQNNDENPNIPNDNAVSVSFLVRLTESTLPGNLVIGDTQNALEVQINTNRTVTATLNRESTATLTLTSSALSIDTTYLLTLAFDDTIGASLYVNDALVDFGAGNGDDLDDTGGYISWNIQPNTFVDMVTYRGYVTLADVQQYYAMITDSSTFFTLSAEEGEPTEKVFSDTGIALYKKALTDSTWSEPNLRLPVKSFSYNAVISPIYENGSGITTFFVQDANDFIDLAQSNDNSDDIVDYQVNLISTNFRLVNRIITFDEGIDSKQYYSNGSSALHSISGETFGSNVFSAYTGIQSVTSWNGYIVVGGYRTNNDNSWGQIWNRADITNTIAVDFGLGQLRVLGNIKGTLFGVVNNFIDNENKALTYPSMDVRVYNGGRTVQTTHRISVPTTMDGYYTNTWDAPVSQLRGRTKNAFMFYAKIPSYDGYIEGLWAVGRNEITDTFALCLLYETAQLGDLTNLATLANQVVVIHSGNVSHLNPEPTYSNTGVIETRIFNDGNSDTEKQLMGVEIMHEALPSGQVITLYKKSDTDTNWVEIFTSSETGKVSKESTSIVSTGDALGNFREIQFKITSTGGKSAVTQLAFRYEDLISNV